MDTEIIRILNTLTSEFYARNAASFSATRDHAWDGWNTCFEVIEEAGVLARIDNVADIGCGNLRFESYLMDKLGTRPEIWAIDNCTQLVPQDNSVHFYQVDIIDELIAHEKPLMSLNIPDCDLACAFGLMHHIPGEKNRLKLIESILDMLRPGGIGIISFWQFMKDDRIAKKAVETTKNALSIHPELELEQNDYLLSWKNETNTFRYCHNFNDSEIDSYVHEIKKNAWLLSRFAADGKTGNLNTYLLFRKR